MLCHIQIAGHIFDIFIINAYEDIKNDFYEDLEHTFNTTPDSCIKILIADFNAKIGKEDIYNV